MTPKRTATLSRPAPRVARPTAAARAGQPNLSMSDGEFATCLSRYARILVHHGAGLVPGQQLFLHAEVAHRQAALEVARAAYDAGAAHVAVFWTDPQMTALLIEKAQLERLEMAHAAEAAWLNEILASRGALISLRGDEDPRLMKSIADQHADRHAVYTRGASFKGKAFLHHGVNRLLCPWVVAGAATPGWAAQVFPDLAPAAATRALWSWIFRFTQADRDDAMERLAVADRRLHGRRRLLDALRIRELHVHGGGSDLRVGLSEKARWLGGSKQTVAGQSFNANVPSEENYSTPDRRRAEGTLRATMPFRTKNGILVEGLAMHFRDGRLDSFDADAGAEGFRRWVDTDEGARFLGEIALVGDESPISQSGLFFEHTLFDENAWSHAALGQSYATALDGGEAMTQAQLDALGANNSAIHTDIMFGSPEVTITASDSAEGAVVLIERGRWVGPFADPVAAS